MLGAFLAGVVLRRWAPGDVHSLEEKLDAVGYGFFIPVFFVSSGMSLDLDSIVEAPLRLLVFFVLLLVVRGLPALLVYRRALPPAQRVQMMLLTATALPLLVALAEIGLSTGTCCRRTPPRWSAPACCRCLVPGRGGRPAQAGKRPPRGPTWPGRRSRTGVRWH